jgi:hypothetical protein
MEKKQTAVEWLHLKLATSSQEELIGNINIWFNEAKAMEKEQMNKASKDLWCEACDYWMNVKTNIKSL